MTPRYLAVTALLMVRAAVVAAAERALSTDIPVQFRP